MEMPAIVQTNQFRAKTSAFQIALHRSNFVKEDAATQTVKYLRVSPPGLFGVEDFNAIDQDTHHFLILDACLRLVVRPPLNKLQQLRSRPVDIVEKIGVSWM
jgi:hypothetical protein